MAVCWTSESGAGVKTVAVAHLRHPTPSVTSRQDPPNLIRGTGTRPWYSDATQHDCSSRTNVECLQHNKQKSVKSQLHRLLD